MKPWAEQFYNSTKWRNCRKSFISVRRAVDGGVCQYCGDKPGYIVHHEVWLTPENISDHDIALNHNNLRFLCQCCHNKIGQEADEPRYHFDSSGQIVPVPPLKKAARVSGQHRAASLV